MNRIEGCLVRLEGWKGGRLEGWIVPAGRQVIETGFNPADRGSPTQVPSGRQVGRLDSPFGTTDGVA